MLQLKITPALIVIFLYLAAQYINSQHIILISSQKNVRKQVQIKRPVKDKLKSAENGLFIKRQTSGTSSDSEW